MGLKDQVLQDNLKTPRHFLRLRLAETALGVADVAKQFALGQQRDRETWEHHKATLGMKSTNEPTDGDEVQLTVGDTHTENHIYNNQPQTTLGKFARAATLGAAILGAGGIGSALTLWACGAFEKKEPAAPVEIDFPDVDGYGLRIFTDEK